MSAHQLVLTKLSTHTNVLSIINVTTGSSIQPSHVLQTRFLTNTIKVKMMCVYHLARKHAMMISHRVTTKVGFLTYPITRGRLNFAI